MSLQTQLEQLTETAYRGLFGLDRNAIAIQLGITSTQFNHEALCDEMGEDALNALSEIESRSIEWMQQFPYRSIPFEDFKAERRTIAAEVGAKWRLVAKEKGIDLLTGKLLRGGGA